MPPDGLLLFFSALTILSDYRRKIGDSVFEFAERVRGFGDNGGERERGEVEG